MAHELRNGNTTEDRKLDRIPAFDPRSLDFRIRSLVTPEQLAKPVSVKWAAPAGTPVLDQGQEGACTGFGTTNGLLFNPNPIKGLDAKFAREQIYWTAQRNDPWRGGAYPGAKPHYDGTAVLYAIKAADKLGYYVQYHWGKSEPELAAGLQVSTAVLGLDWYNDMFEPDKNGFIHPTGGKAGGHCILATEINIEQDYYTLHNSWGPTWGNNGDCKIRRGDLAKLLADDGECCIITKKPVSPMMQLVTERIEDNYAAMKSAEAGNAAMGQAA